VGLGSNLGDRKTAFAEALRQLKETPGIEISGLSPVYETSPVGLEGPAFYNAVTRIRTSLTPPELLERLLEIEVEMGRRRTGAGKDSRIIDLDLLTMGNEIIRSEKLSLPHPEMAERLFVLLPFKDLDPGMKPPGWAKTVSETARLLASRDKNQKVTSLGRLDEL
jgi:2-amino-4-hydroxy-6-hydroxymethyldihydropteridine diphosphokinase